MCIVSLTSCSRHLLFHIVKIRIIFYQIIISTRVTLNIHNLILITLYIIIFDRRTSKFEIVVHLHLIPTPAGLIESPKINWLIAQLDFDIINMPIILPITPFLTPNIILTSAILVMFEH